MAVESVGLRNKLLRKVEELKSDSVCSGTPDEFLCPITRELMREPVIAAGKRRSDLFLSTQFAYNDTARKPESSHETQVLQCDWICLF